MRSSSAEEGDLFLKDLLLSVCEKTQPVTSSCTKDLDMVDLLKNGLAFR